MKKSSTLKWLMAFLTLIFLGACSSSDTASTGSGDTGTLSLSLIDASDETYKAVYVTIEEVQVCHETGFAEGDEDATCEWKTIVTLNKTYNLLTLVNGVTAELGEAQLEVGTYNQMRLILGETPENASHPFPQYLITMDDQVHEMKVPSGYNSGIKLVSQFEIQDSERTELILDFDVTRSIHLAGVIGNNGKYILRPTIKVIGTYNRALVSGIVFNAAYLEQPLPNATVTAWPIGDASLTPTSTQTDETGGYTLNLGLGENPQLSQDYTLVATLNGFQPDCDPITVSADQDYPDTDFGLSNADMITVSGTITGNIAAAELPAEVNAPSVHISFMQDCLTVPVEVAYTDITDDTNASTYDNSNGNFTYQYEVNVPSGIYDVVATVENGLTVEYSNFDATTTPVTQDINF